jgi:hypothetical protein
MRFHLLVQESFLKVANQRASRNIIPVDVCLVNKTLIGKGECRMREPLRIENEKKKINIQKEDIEALMRKELTSFL